MRYGLTYHGDSRPRPATAPFGLTQTVAPLLEPVTLDEARRQVRQDLPVDDDYLADLVAECREQVEHDTRRALVSLTWKLTLDVFPPGAPSVFWGGWSDWTAGGPIRLPRASPLQAVTSVAYVDGGGTTDTLSPTLYQVLSDREPAWIVPAYAQVWPVTRLLPAAVAVTYTAGFVHTTVALAIATGLQTVTPADVSGIVQGQSVTVGAGVARETVTVSAVTPTTFTATFAKSHQPGAVVSRVPRPLRSAILLLVGHRYRFRGDDGRADQQAPPPAYARLVGSWDTGDY